MSKEFDALKAQIAQAKSVMQTAAATIQALRDGTSISGPDALDAMSKSLGNSSSGLDLKVAEVAASEPVDEPAPVDAAPLVDGEKEP